MRSVVPAGRRCRAICRHWRTGNIQGVGAQVLLVRPFDAAPDGSNALEVRLVAKLPKDASVEIRRHVEEPRLAVFESDV